MMFFDYSKISEPKSYPCEEILASHSGVLFKAANVTCITVYNSVVRNGVLAISIGAAISFTAILLLLIGMSLKIYSRAGKAADEASRFIRSPVGSYFVCLLVSNILTSTGYMMTFKWIVKGRIELGNYCTAQGAIKQIGNISSAMWCIVIAVHTFVVVFLERQPPQMFAPMIILGIWFLILLIFIIPFLASMSLLDTKGPWWGVRGFWCSVSGNYFYEMYFLEYFFMGVVAVATLVIYGLMYLRIRGNLTPVKDTPLPTNNNNPMSSECFFRRRCFRQFRFTIRHRQKISADNAKLAKKMLYFPLVYAILLVPLSLVKVGDVMKVEIIKGVKPKIACNFIYMLSGLVNVLLYAASLRVFILPWIRTRMRLRQKDDPFDENEPWLPPPGTTKRLKLAQTPKVPNDELPEEHSPIYNAEGFSEAIAKMLEKGKRRASIKPHVEDEKDARELPSPADSPAMLIYDALASPKPTKLMVQTRGGTTSFGHNKEGFDGRRNDSLLSPVSFITVSTPIDHDLILSSTPTSGLKRSSSSVLPKSYSSSFSSVLGYDRMRKDGAANIGESPQSISSPAAAITSNRRVRGPRLPQNRRKPEPRGDSQDALIPRY